MYWLLALGSAACYGAADFLGGFTSRRAHTVAIVLVSQCAGLLLVATLLPIVGTPVPVRSDWLWAAIAGLTGGIGVALLYRALAVGVMAVVAPITAVCAVLVPVAAALILGERPGARASAGIILAIGAIVLVSQQPARDDDRVRSTQRRAGLGLAVAAGLAIGLFFLALARTTPSSGLWPLLAARVVSITVFGAFSYAAGIPLGMAPHVAGLAFAGGLLDMLANLLYLLATRAGPLTLVVTLSSLYPASTVMLARFVLHERLSVPQWIGVGCALAATVLIVAA